MKKAFEHDFYYTSDETAEADIHELTQDEVDKYHLINKLNQLTDYGDIDQHTQHYLLIDTQKWLQAHISYQQLPNKSYGVTERNHQETDKALRNGVFFDLAIRNIEENMRDLGSHMFVSDKLLQKNQLSDEDERAIASQNRIYYEAWASLKDQSENYTQHPLPLPLQDIILAKKLFQDGHALANQAEKQHELSHSLTVALSSYNSLAERGASSSFAAISTRTLVAYALHDLSQLGEFGDNNDAAHRLSIELLWQNAEELTKLRPGLIAEQIKQKYLNEIEYMRGQYSEEIGLNPDVRPDSSEDRKQVIEKLGRLALEPILQRAA